MHCGRGCFVRIGWNAREASPSSWLPLSYQCGSLLPRIEVRSVFVAFISVPASAPGTCRFGEISLARLLQSQNSLSPQFLGTPAATNGCSESVTAFDFSSASGTRAVLFLPQRG